MATVDMTVGTTTDNDSGNHISKSNSPMIYTVERTLNWADAVTTKGSALATGDIFQVIFVPRNTMLHGATAEVVEAGENTGATINIDVGGGDDFVDGGAIDSTGWLAPGTNGFYPFESNTVGPQATSDFIDVTLVDVPGASTLATGKVRVIAYMSDVSETSKAAEASRDQLA